MPAARYSATFPNPGTEDGSSAIFVRVGYLIPDLIYQKPSSLMHLLTAVQFTNYIHLYYNESDNAAVQ